MSNPRLESDLVEALRLVIKDIESRPRDERRACLVWEPAYDEETYASLPQAVRQWHEACPYSKRIGMVVFMPDALVHYSEIGPGNGPFCERQDLQAVDGVYRVFYSS